MATLSLVLHIFRDLLIRFLPKRIALLLVPQGEFAFVVHPRDYRDFARKYHFSRRLPRNLIEFVLKHLWPLIVAPITGLKDKEGKEILGYLIGCPLTAFQMLSDRQLAQRRILQSVRLAEKIGAKIVGLGGLTASLTKGGLDLKDKVKAGITSGYAYTTLTVTGHALRACRVLGLDVEEITIAIVGAGGNVGSNSAKLIAKNGAKKLLLIDLLRKKSRAENLIKFLKTTYPEIEVSYSPNIKEIRNTDLIITATNAPETVIKSEYVKPGTVIVDDAQPSDVDHEVIMRDDVIVLSGGVVHTPGVRTHFNFGLAHKDDNYSCLVEILILAAHHWQGHCSIGELDERLIEKIENMSREFGFKLGDFQNEYKLYSSEDFDRISKIRKGYKK